MINRAQSSWKCSGGRNGKAPHAEVNNQTDKCLICGEPFSDATTTRRILPRTLMLIILADIIITLVGGVAYWLWFKPCASGQQKIGNACVATQDIPVSKVSPSPQPPPPNPNQVFNNVQQQFSGVNSDRVAFDNALKQAEQQFPNDYRFTYQRVRIYVDAPGEIGHKTSFSLLKQAAKKAIESQQSATLSKQLLQDSQQTKNIKKLAHGHAEWWRILNALEQNNASLLK